MSMSMSALIAAVRSRHTTNEIKRLMPQPVFNRATRRAAAHRSTKTK